jgi:flagellar hook-basal body complex protein FliE
MTLAIKPGPITLEGVQDYFARANQSAPKQQTLTGDGKSFSAQLLEGLNEVNSLQATADSKGAEIATGKSTELHEAMIAASKAELSFNFMVQLRNKVLEAYTEVMRMPV